MKSRTYPRVDLSKVINWVNLLSYYGLPLIELSTKRLEERVKKGTLSPKLKATLIGWKDSKGIRDSDELEYKYFIQGIGAVNERPLSHEDLEIPLSENLTLMEVVDSGSKAKIYYLSRQGMLLWNFQMNQQHHLYEAAMFWLLLRSEVFNPLIQMLLSDRRVYEAGIQDEFIPSQDGVSRALVKKWLSYFGLFSQNRIDRSRLATMLLFASTLEINEHLNEGQWKEYVGDICRFLSTRFSLSEGVIDFGIFLDYLYSHVPPGEMVGFPSGRGHRGLPRKPSVQFLEINNPISLHVVEVSQACDVTKAIAIGGFT